MTSTDVGRADHQIVAFLETFRENGIKLNLQTDQEAEFTKTAPRSAIDRQ